MGQKHSLSTSKLTQSDQNGDSSTSNSLSPHVPLPPLSLSLSLSPSLLSPPPSTRSIDRRLCLSIHSGDLFGVGKSISKGANVNIFCHDINILTSLAEGERVRISTFQQLPPLHPLNPIGNPHVKVDYYKVNQNAKFNSLSLHTVALIPLTPIMLAAHVGSVAILTLLLQSAANYKMKSEDGRTALMIAAHLGKAQIVEEIIKFHKAKSMVNQHHRQMAQSQLQSQSVALATNTSAPNSDSSVPSSSSSPSPSTSPSSSLVVSPHHPPPPPLPLPTDYLDFRDEFGQTALLKASSMGFAHIIELLVRAGADVNISDYLEGMTAIAWAAEHGPSSIIGMLVRAGADVNIRNHNGQTPLIRAASKDFNSIFNVQNSENEKNNNFPNEMKMSLTLNDNNEIKSLPTIRSPSLIVDSLILGGADVNAKNHDGYSALMVSSWQGHSSVVERLISAGANVNAQAEKGQTALMLAVTERRTPIVQLLLYHKPPTSHIHSDIHSVPVCDVNLSDLRGETALHKAVMKGDAFIVNLLLSSPSNININVRDNTFGNSPLICAAQLSHSSIVEMLCRSGADVTLTNHLGETAMKKSIEANDSFSLFNIIKYGGNPNGTEGFDGNNTLHCCVKRDQNTDSHDILLLLLDNGADVNRKNHRGESPLDLAIKLCNVRQTEILSSASTGSEQEILNIVDKYHSETSSSSSSPSPHKRHVPLGTKEKESENVIFLLRESVLRGIKKRKEFENRKKRIVERENRNSKGNTQKDTHTNSNSSSVTLNGNQNSSAPTHSSSPPNGIFPMPMVISPSLLQDSSTHSQSHMDSGNFNANDEGSSASSPSSPSPSPPLPSSLLPLSSWSVFHVSQWLSSLGLPQYISTFSDCSVDGDLLIALIDNENLLIDEMKIERKIHRMKILKEIKKLIENSVENPKRQISSQSQISLATASSGGSQNGKSPSPSLSPSPSPSPSIVPQSLSSSSSAPLPKRTSPPLTENNHSEYCDNHNQHHQQHHRTSPYSPNVNGIPHDGEKNMLPFDGIHLPPIPSLTETYAEDKNHNLLSSSSSFSATALINTNLNFNIDKMLQSDQEQNSNENSSPFPITPTPNLSSSLFSKDNGIQNSMGMVYSEPIHSNGTVLQWSSSGTVSSTSLSDVSVSLVSPSPSPHWGYDLPLLRKDFEDPSPMSSSDPSLPRPLRFRSDLPAPRSIPSSEIILKKEIGRGSFGCVFVGEWRGAMVAVKKFHLKLSEWTKEDRDNFIRESAMMELLNHHFHIVRFCGISWEENHANIVLEYLANGSIRSILNKRRERHLPPLPILLIFQLAKDIASGLLHLHLEGVIHRDLAARNLLIDNNWRVKISDFGMSRIKIHTNANGRTVSQFLAAKWSSPESLSRSEYSEKTDVFSFAISVWEILSQQEPYPTMTDLEVAVRISTDQKSQFRPPIPPFCPFPLKNLLEKCWHFDPNVRPKFKEIMKTMENIIQFTKYKMKNQKDKGEGKGKKKGNTDNKEGEEKSEGFDMPMVHNDENENEDLSDVKFPHPDDPFSSQSQSILDSQFWDDFQ